MLKKYIYINLNKLINFTNHLFYKSSTNFNGHNNNYYLLIIDLRIFNFAQHLHRKIISFILFLYDFFFRNLISLYALHSKKQVNKSKYSDLKVAYTTAR